MQGLRFTMFGKFCMHWDGAEVFELESGKAEELLCYLLIHRERAHPRDALAEVLWGKETTNQSKNYLRKALWQLQSALDHLASEKEQHLLLVEHDWIQINPKCHLWLDVAVLEEAYKGVKGVPGRNLSQGQARSLEVGVALYKGDLLEDCYRDWCLFERERLQYLFLASLDKLMDYCEKHGDYETGLMHGERVLRYDRAHERTHNRLMRLHYLAGDRTAAMHQYEKCLVALHEELDVEPGKVITDLYRQIRQDTMDVDIYLENEKKSQPDGETLQTIYTHLGRFYQAIDQFQTQLHKDIQILERVMRKQ